MKILTVIGARPQFIKAATVSRVIREREDISEYIVHTGQHYDAGMSEVFFNELHIPKPNLNLNVGSGLHGEQTAKMLSGLEQAIMKEKPDAVLVYGDTNSTLAGALAAVKLLVPVCHVEAGLRSFNRRMPEEINRIMTDHASDLLFAPTVNAIKQLQFEGIAEDKIILSGDVMLDAALFYVKQAENESRILDQLGLRESSYILTTVHRAENTDDPEMLQRIMSAIDAISKKHSVILPIHPRTRAKLDTFGIETQHIKFIDPVGYLDMVNLEKNAALIITDSGGVQKEAYFFRKPCITLRAETEWLELVEEGWNKLSPPSVVTAKSLLHDTEMALNQTKAISNKNLYGTGNSAQNIVEEIVSKYDKPA